MGLAIPRNAPQSLIAASDDTSLYSVSYADKDIQAMKSAGDAKDVEGKTLTTSGAGNFLNAIRKDPELKGLKKPREEPPYMPDAAKGERNFTEKDHALMALFKLIDQKSSGEIVEMDLVELLENVVRMRETKMQKSAAISIEDVNVATLLAEECRDLVSLLGQPGAKRQDKAADRADVDMDLARLGIKLIMEELDANKQPPVALFSGRCRPEAEDFFTNPQNRLGGHEGPVTGLSLHPGVSADGVDDDDNWKAITDEYGDLVLSSSTDWTVRLWNYQHQPKKRGETSAAEIIGLKCFEDPKDYVYDVAWSPEHPALFAAVDGQGFLSLYDLTSPDMEMPVAKYQVGAEDGAAPASGLNRVAWCPKHTSKGEVFEGPGCEPLSLCALDSTLSAVQVLCKAPCKPRPA